MSMWFSSGNIPAVFTISWARVQARRSMLSFGESFSLRYAKHFSIGIKATIRRACNALENLQLLRYNSGIVASSHSLRHRVKIFITFLVNALSCEINLPKLILDMKWHRLYYNVCVGLQKILCARRFRRYIVVYASMMLILTQIPIVSWNEMKWNEMRWNQCGAISMNALSHPARYPPHHLLSLSPVQSQLFQRTKMEINWLYDLFPLFAIAGAI